MSDIRLWRCSGCGAYIEPGSVDGDTHPVAGPDGALAGYCGPVSLYLAGDVPELHRQLAEQTALREADQATIATLGEINRELADALQHLYASWQSYADWSGNPANAPIRKQTERALRSAGRTP